VPTPKIPSVLTDLARDRVALNTLLVASLALLAAGLAPRVLSPGLATVQSAVRSNDASQVLILLGSVLAAGMLLVGGVLGDADGRKRIMIACLIALAGTALIGPLISDGPQFVIARALGVGSASIVLPLAFAGVATSYEGIPRATAIGIAYAAYGAGLAADPVLLTLFGPEGPYWPAYLAAATAAFIALWAARRSWGDLPAPGRTDRVPIVLTAVWAFGIVVLTAGLLGFQGDGVTGLRIAFGVVGGLLLSAGLIHERRNRTHPSRSPVRRKAVAVALLVGFVIAYAQASTLLQVSVYFQVILRYGPVWSMIATLPFMAALVVAGPVAGILLGRWSPRSLIVLGLLAVGLGNVLIAIVLRPDASYPGFGLAFALIGAGFVIATTVRTAIIFASVPRGLPATAAALNEASVALGARAGLVIVTLLVTRLALGGYEATLTGLSPDHVSTAMASFQEILTAIGLPQFGALVGGLSALDSSAYAVAYSDAVRSVTLSTGVVTLVTAPIVAILLGRRDPLGSVWEHEDERETSTPSVITG
jgi:CRISPR-associated Cas5-like protein